MAVIDATMLMLFLRPDVGVPSGPDGSPVDHPIERIDYLVSQLEKDREKIIIPTPALSEVLVRADPTAAQEIVERVQKYSVFRIEPFGMRAAIEVAAMTRSALDGGKKKRDSAATWAKLKYDRQIVATAIVTQSPVIYSDDRHIITLAKRAKIAVVGLADLPLPPEDAQLKLFTEQPKEEEPSAEELRKVAEEIEREEASGTGKDGAP